MALSEAFLKEAYKLAKKQLPGWAYAAILIEARGRAGGKAARKKGVSEPDEEIALDEIEIEAQTGEDLVVAVTKAKGEKKIVYGVVLDPYGKEGATPDAHGDWPTPAMIEETSHAFMQTNRTIGLQHKGNANAMLVESHIEQYPTTKDYEAAMIGLPHKVTRRKFGDDVVHSGSWVVGVQLGDAEWELYKSGQLNAFSPGGIGVKRSITEQMLPEVEFVDA